MVTYRVPAHVQAHPLHDEVVLLDARRDAFHGLNPTAAVAWRVLAAGQPPAAAVEALVERFEIDDDGAVDDAVVGEAVATAAHRQREGVVAGEGDRRGDVLGVRRADDRERTAIEGDVEGRTGRIEVGAVGRDEPAGQPRAQRVQRVAGERAGGAGGEGSVATVKGGSFRRCVGRGRRGDGGAAPGRAPAPADPGPGSAGASGYVTWRYATRLENDTAC